MSFAGFKALYIGSLVCLGELPSQHTKMMCQRKVSDFPKTHTGASAIHSRVFIVFALAQPPPTYHHHVGRVWWWGNNLETLGLVEGITQKYGSCWGLA
jgi:hypothetical protein